MRTFVRNLAFSLAACMLVVSPVVEARDNAPRATGRPSSSQSRPSSSRGGSTAPRGNASGGRPSTSTPRPGTPNGSATVPRPGGQAQPSRPGSSGRPNTASRPGTTNRPSGPSVAPGGPGRPGHGPAMRPPVMQPAPRPYRPVLPIHYARPVPPRSWRPVYGCPTISGILGIAFGTSINLSLDYLYGGGYSISGYNNNTVYLTDINAFNYMWPDATLYYGPSGLTYSQFYYSTQYYDLARYNAIRASLIAQYGSPVSVTSQPGGGYVSTWFGYNNSYITLSFGQDAAVGGGNRFFTTLTFGN